MSMSLYNHLLRSRPSRGKAPERKPSNDGLILMVLLIILALILIIAQ